MKKTHPRSFNGLAASAGNKRPVNSGIYSNSGSGQKMDSKPKLSRSDGPPTGGKGVAAVQRAAIDNTSIKAGPPKKSSGKTSPSALLNYALK